MKKILLFGLFLASIICFGQNYGAYSQLKPLEGSVSDDMQQAQANAYRRREEKREIERIKYEREQQLKERQRQENQSQWMMNLLKTFYSQPMKIDTPFLF